MNDFLSKPQVAFLGLGLMGSGMARRLLKAGYPVSAYNRSLERAASLATDGAKIASTPREAAQGAKIVISMVSDDTASRALWMGADGALLGAAAGTTFIECSTVSVGWIKELAAAAAARGIAFLDSPVTGSKPQAAAGELTFLVGGSAETLENVRPVLVAMSRAIVHLGPVGSGALVKLINNFVCGVQAAALAEAIALIEHSDLEPTKALEVIANGAPGSPLVKTFGGRMTTPDYTPNFHLHLMAKDLAYAQAEGVKYALPMATAAAALSLFKRAIAEGHGEKDVSAVVEPLRAIR